MLFVVVVVIVEGYFSLWCGLIIREDCEFNVRDEWKLWCDVFFGIKFGDFFILFSFYV